MKRNIHKISAYAFTVVWAFIVLSSGYTYAIPSRPEPQRLVNDLAGLFSQGQIQTLERTLVEFDDTTSNQITVITTRDLEGMDVAEYATRIGIEWQVGSERFDNGIVIVVKPKENRSDGQVFIAVGYGLEGAIPDAYAKRIISNIMIPHFMGNDYYGGVTEACRTLMALASGEISEMREYDEGDEAAMLFGLFLLFMILIIIIAAIKGGGNSGSGNKGRGPVIFTGPIITRGHDYGGFGGGGFSSGGFGGFGGFGGGSFGGGGAGGSW